MRRGIAMALVFSLLMVTAGGAVWAETSLPEKLAAVERVIFGREQSGTGSLVERVTRLEDELYGQQGRGPLLARVETMYEQVVLGGSVNSLLLQLNAVEWMLYQEISPGEPLGSRLATLENQVVGERSTGPLQNRIRALADMVWPGGHLNVADVEIEAETLVMIRLEAEVNSRTNRVGQLIPYKVARDVTIDDRLVIPRGTRGEAKVTNVQSAGGLGKSGRVELDFGTITALDGTKVRLQVAEKAAKENTEMAAAASIGGLVLLGPIGLVGGLFVRGDHHVIPAGTEFYVEVDRPVTVQGLALKPTGI